MKHFFRVFIFSFFALFITSFWNKGFSLPITSGDFMKAALALTILYVLVRPLLSLVFLPLNLITFGMFSFVLFIFCIHLLVSVYGIFSITAWEFMGVTISYVGNLVLSSFGISSIINVLDQLT